MNGLNEKSLAIIMDHGQRRSLSNGLLKIIQNESSKNSFPSRRHFIFMAAKSYSL